MENSTLTWQERSEIRVKERQQERINRMYFPVEKVKTGTVEGKERYAIINKETGEKLSDVSERYCLVKNKDVFNPFINRFGADKIKTFYGYGNSKYAHMEIKTGRRFNFGTEEKPDWLDEMVVVTNSYNKTKSFSFKIGAFRWVCSNGLYSGEALVEYKKIHVGEIPVIPLVFKALLEFENNSFDTWKKFRNTEMTLEEQLKISDKFIAVNIKDEDKQTDNEKYNNINNKIRRTARWLLEQKENADNQRNAWGLYNQINRAIAHHMNGKAKVGQRMTTNNRAEKYLVETVLN